MTSIMRNPLCLHEAFKPFVELSEITCKSSQPNSLPSLQVPWAQTISLTSHFDLLEALRYCSQSSIPCSSSYDSNARRPYQFSFPFDLWPILLSNFLNLNPETPKSNFLIHVKTLTDLFINNKKLIKQ